MDPNKKQRFMKEAWLWFQDLSEEESVGGETDDPSFSPGNESSTEDEEPVL